MTESQFDLFGTEITTSVNQQVASDFTSAGFEPETTPDRHPKHDRESGTSVMTLSLTTLLYGAVSLPIASKAQTASLKAKSR